MSRGRRIFLVIGIILALAAAGLIVFCVAMFWANSTYTNNEGYHVTETLSFEEDSYAVAVNRGDIHLTAAWLWDWGNLVDFKIEASNIDTDKPIFIGFAGKDDFVAYFNGVPYKYITDLSIRPCEVESVSIPGNSRPVIPPASIDDKPPYEKFWEASINGAGIQTLECELEAEDYVLVLMNADGSAGVDMTVEVGAKASLILGTAVAFLVAAIVTVILAAVMFNYAARGLPYSKSK